MLLLSAYLSLAATKTVQGTAVDNNGQPFPRVSVRAVQGTYMVQRVTDQQGNFNFTGLPQSLDTFVLAIAGFSVTVNSISYKLGKIQVWPDQTTAVLVSGQLNTGSSVVVVLQVTYPPKVGSFAASAKSSYSFQLEFPGFLIFEIRVLVFCMAGDVLDYSQSFALTQMNNMEISWNSQQIGSCCAAGNKNFINIIESCTGATVEGITNNQTAQSQCCTPGCGFNFGAGQYFKPCGEIQKQPTSNERQGLTDAEKQLTIQSEQQAKQVKSIYKSTILKLKQQQQLQQQQAKQANQTKQQELAKQAKRKQQAKKAQQAKQAQQAENKRQAQLTNHKQQAYQVKQFYQAQLAKQDYQSQLVNQNKTVKDKQQAQQATHLYQIQLEKQAKEAKRLKQEQQALKQQQANDSKQAQQVKQAYFQNVQNNQKVTIEKQIANKQKQAQKVKIVYEQQAKQAILNIDQNKNTSQPENPPADPPEFVILKHAKLCITVQDIIIQGTEQLNCNYDQIQYTRKNLIFENLTVEGNFQLLGVFNNSFLRKAHHGITDLIR